MAGPNYMYNGVENLACWIDDEDVNDHKKNVDDARGNTYLHQQQQSNVDDRRSHRSRVNKTLSSPSVMANSTPTVNNNIVVINKDVDMKDKIIDKEGPPSEPPEKLMDFDDVLPHIGEFGVYQIILFFLTAPFCLFLAFSYFSQVFITLVPDHTCHVPQLNSSGLNITQKREISIPLVGPSVLGGTTTFDSCSMYDVDYETVVSQGLRPNSSWPTRPCQHGWDYDVEQIRYHSVVTENNWVCDRAGYAPMAQAVFFCGSIVGGIVLGFIADRFGRIPALILCNLIGALAGVITTVSTSFGVFAFSRFLMGIAFDNCFTLIYILVLEYVGPTYRTVVANLSIALFYTLGTTVLPWIAWAIRDWRMLSLVTALPMALSVVAYWIVPESARWLLSQGQTDRAISILRTFARINKKQVDESVYKKLKTSTEEAIKASSSEPASTVLDLLKTPRLRRNTILLTLLWVLVAVVYDGHARNTANLGLSVFVTFSVASVTELPADLVLVFFLDRWGRRALAFGSLFGAALFSLFTLAVPVDQAVLTAILAIIGRFCVNITFNIGLQYGAELIPTAVRAQGIAYVHIAGYVASIISPYIVDLARFSQFLPLTILGVLAVVGSLVGLMLPETLGAILPETMEDGENFGKDQSFWEFPCCQKPKQIEPEEEEPVPELPPNLKRSSVHRVHSMRASIRGESLRSNLLVRPKIPQFNNTGSSSRNNSINKPPLTHRQTTLT